MLKTWISEEAGDAASIQKLMEVSPYFGINYDQALALLSPVVRAVSRWRQIGKQIGMTNFELEAFESAFEHEELMLARQMMIR